MTTAKNPRAYATTWVVFCFLLMLVGAVFTLTSVNKKEATPLDYGQLRHILVESPGRIEKISLIGEEPIVLIKLKNSVSRQTMDVTPEQKSKLLDAVKKAGIPVETLSADRSTLETGISTESQGSH